MVTVCVFCEYECMTYTSGDRIEYSQLNEQSDFTGGDGEEDTNNLI